MPERLVFGPQPALEVGSFAQVIEGHADRCEPGVRPPVVNRRVGRITHVSLLIRVVQSGFWNRPAKATRDITLSRRPCGRPALAHLPPARLFPGWCHLPPRQGTPSGQRNGRRVARPPPVRSPVTTPRHTCRPPLLSGGSAKTREPASPLCR